MTNMKLILHVLLKLALLIGIGRFAGMDIIEMEDVTGGIDTNLENIRDTILDQVKKFRP